MFARVWTSRTRTAKNVEPFLRASHIDHLGSKMFQVAWFIYLTVSLSWVSCIVYGKEQLIY